MHLSTFVCLVAMTLMGCWIERCHTLTATDLINELEKELKRAKNEKKEVAKEVKKSPSIQELHDMKSRLEDLEKDLLKGESFHDGISEKAEVKRMKTNMANLEKEMEGASRKRNTKKSVLDKSLDELIGELKQDSDVGNSQEDFKRKFYDILGYKQTKRSDVDYTFKRAYLEGTLESMLDYIRTSRKDDAVDTKLSTKREKDEETCVDKRSDCKNLQPYCETHRAKLEGACDLTCGYCRVCKNSGKLSDETCKALRHESKRNPQGLDYCFMDGYVERMRTMCYKSCGYCNAPAPPRCSSTEHGCCWDKTTTKLDKEGSNCLPCKNAYKNACTTFKVDCTSRYKPGEFMHQYCPETCDLCSNGCSNERGFEDYCTLWKSENWCTTHEDQMRHYCSKECGFC